MKMTKILLVEDDFNIVKNLSYLLEEEGYDVAVAMGQKQALDLFEQGEFDLLLLDVSLPDGNGYAICTAVRKMSEVPVIFLTASDDEMNVVTGLDIGADDYITKPFRPMELLSRMKSVLRRRGKAVSVFRIGSLQVDSVRGIVHKGEKEIFLSALEYRLLLVFLNNKGIVMSRSQLLECIWDVAGDFVNDNTLTVYIKRLREKIEDDPQNPKVIKTVRGLGYKMEGDA